MAQFAGFLRDGKATPLDARDLEPDASLGAYLARLSEEERRFGNRRLARSISLAAAHEALALRRFLSAAREHFAGKIVPRGYARRPPARELPRTVCALLSDLHFGAELSPLDNPVPFGALEEARRFERVVREIADYKPQYRASSRLVLMLAGDLIDGRLLKDLRDGAPLTEQVVATLKYLSAALAFLSAAYRDVRVVCQAGNHGRDIIRHPGRATSSKWDCTEWQVYKVLELMSERLGNVHFDVPFRAVSAVELYDAWMLVTHGDTEVKLKHPDTGAAENARTVHRINSTLEYGHVFSVLAAGHFHSGRLQLKHPTALVFNGALLPANGYGRTEGHTDERCGQWMWEAVPGHPVGDARFVEVGPADDHDPRLGKLIKPFRFPR